METTPEFKNPACRVAPPGMFHPDRLEIGYAKYLAMSADALAICGTCEHRRDCLTYALTAQERDGVWGHTTETDRANIVWAHNSNHPDAAWVKTTDQIVDLVRESDMDPATIDRIKRFLHQQRAKIRALATAIEHALPEAAQQTNEPAPVDDQPLTPDIVAVLRVLAEGDAATWQIRKMTGNKNVARHVTAARSLGLVEPTGELSKTDTRQYAPVYRLTDAGYERIPDE